MMWPFDSGRRVLHQLQTSQTLADTFTQALRPHNPTAALKLLCSLSLLPVLLSSLH